MTPNIGGYDRQKELITFTISHHNLPYTKLISAGDSKTFNILTETMPYAVQITKLEYIGPV